MTAKAVLYLRVSTEEEAETGTSLETQELACLRKVAALGGQVIGIHKDEGVSGGFYLSRPGIQAALCDLEAKRADVLIVASLSRFSRDAEHQQAIRKRIERAGAGASLRKLAIYMQETGQKTQRGGKCWYTSTIRYVLKNPAYKGQPVFGRFQWRTDEARMQKGLKAQFSRPGPEAEQVLLSCEPIVDASIWQQAQERLQENPGLFSGPVERRHLLVGLLRCPVCHRSMGSEIDQKKKQLYYRCPQSRPSRSVTGYVCTKKMHNGRIVEGLILRDLGILARKPERFEQALSTYERQRRLSQKSCLPEETERLRVELANLDTQEATTARAQIDALMKGRSTDVYDRLLSDLDEKRKPIRARLAKLEAAQETVPAIDCQTTAHKIEEVLRRVDTVLSAEDLTPAEKHEVLATLVKAIYPRDDGYSILLRSSCGGTAHGLDSVQMISIH